MRRPFSLAPLTVLVALVVVAAPARAERVVVVPSLEGLAIENALARLTAVGLEAHVVEVPEGEAGRVLSQHPGPHTRVERGAVVELAVALRVRVETVVPDVRGMDGRAAAAALEGVYRVEIQDVASERGQDNRVLGQRPRAGMALPYRGVLTLLVARAGLEAGLVPVPAVSGTPFREAQRAVLDRGLVPESVFVRVAAGARGRGLRVLSQMPDPNVAVVVGSRVQLRVPLPARQGRLRMPSVVGLEPDEAERVLGALGLRMAQERVPSRFDEHTVIMQSPALGEPVLAGAEVRVVVGIRTAWAPALVAVPDLRHLTLADVFGRLRDVGLRADLRRRLAPERAPDQVLAQRPGPGGRVPYGTLIRVDLPLLATVPSVVGLDAEGAARRLDDAGLEMALEGDARRGGRGRVVAQTPSVGDVVARGSLVRTVLRRRHGEQRARVPDLRDLDLDEARRRIEAAGLEARFHGPAYVVGGIPEIVQQQPSAGEVARAGTTVHVMYRVRPAPTADRVMVPNLLGRSIVDAQRLLARAGLLGAFSYVRGGGPPGVTGQVPAPGTQVRRGTEVRVTARR